MTLNMITAALGPTSAIMGNAVSGLVDRAAATLDQTLDPRADNPAIREAAVAWEGAKRAIDALPGILRDFAAASDRAVGNGDLTDVARNAQVKSALDVATAGVRRVIGSVETSLERVAAYLRPGSAPARPGEDAVTEARIAAAKTDVAIVLSSVPDDVDILAAEWRDCSSEPSATTTR